MENPTPTLAPASARATTAAAAPASPLAAREFWTQSTGSDALDTLLDKSRTSPRKVLRVCGGEAHLQRQLLFGFCSAATARGESAVFLDLDDALDARAIERAGLLGDFNPAEPADPTARFRVLVPTDFAQVRTVLEGLAKVSPAPAVVAIGGLQAALFRSFPSPPKEERELWRVDGTVLGAMLGYYCAASDGNFTLWIAHSPKVGRVTGGPSTPFNGKFASTARNRMQKESGGGLRIGAVLPQSDGSYRVAVEVRDYRDNLATAGTGAFEIWQSGQFKNE